MVACHPAVDAVCIFDAATPRKALMKFGVCRLVKGPDYTIEQVRDRDIVQQAGGSVAVMPKGSSTDDISTTATIDKVKNGNQAQSNR
jgi:bifunctional ADP-heptose synthase (sugar kinase/adenylyltransferase)